MPGQKYYFMIGV